MALKKYTLQVHGTLTIHAENSADVMTEALDWSSEVEEYGKFDVDIIDEPILQEASS